MRIAAIGFGILAVTAGSCWFAPAVKADTAPIATPPGVTLQTVRLGSGEAGGAMARQATRDAYADAKGMTLYTFDKDAVPGKSACIDDCAKAWLPLVVSAVPADARAFGSWSIVTRDNGAKQWAYGGKPLYTFAKDTKVGDAGGNGVDGAWHVASFLPVEGLVLPDGVAVQELLNAGGEVFVSDLSGMPLYTFDGDPAQGKPACIGSCVLHWQPAVAAQLAKPVGDFTVAHRDDGLYQWSYKGKPLYTFDGDVIAGDAKGDGAAGKWHVATLLRQFMPPGVAVWHNRYGGDNLATADGMTLYERDRVSGTSTGHNLRTGQRGNPTVGRLLGVASCDAECAKTWRPFVASASAQPSGYWDVVARDDGAKQWAYRGFPVYTYAGDKKPGDMTGNDTYEIQGEEDPYRVADIGIKAAGAMVWHTIAP